MDAQDRKRKRAVKRKRSALLFRWVLTLRIAIIHSPLLLTCSGQVIQTCVDCLHVSEFGVDIKQVPSHRSRYSVTDTFFHCNRTEAFGQAVTQRGADTG